MERRNFLKGALAIFGVAAAGVALGSGAAEAATREAPMAPAAPELEPAGVTETDAEGQIFFVRRRYYRPRRIYYVRRRYYRPRYVVRRRYYRRIYW